jgi:hypothetical protein
MTTFCPLCGAVVPTTERYPRALCGACAALACDAHGRSLEFFNESLSGGFIAQYADTGEPYPSHECWVRGVLCWADEARFGGIVVSAGTPHGSS